MRLFMNNSMDSRLQFEEPYTDCTDRSKLVNESVNCPYLLATKGGVVQIGKFRLTNGSTVFAAKIPCD